MKNRKGFTLVELLAVVTILGIIMMVSIPAVSRYINKSKQESKESQKETLSMAAKSYARSNTSVLPKAIGETKTIAAKELRDAKYLKEDLVDADKKDCMKDSFVRIYKYDTKGYTYTSYIYCEGDVVPATIEGIKPNINIRFTDTKNNTNASQNVSISSLEIIIDGNVDMEGNKLGLDGYSYIISVTYSDTGKLVEIFNSGSLNAGGRETLTIEKDLTEYVDITTINKFLVTVEAYNRDGGYRKETADSSYKDTTKPICGTITGQAGENEWNKSWRSKKISITCSDGDGSGCVKDKYTKTFDTEMETGYITIADNAGNTTDCPVRVHLDWTTPSVTMVAYKRNSNGTKGAEVGKVQANNGSQTVTLSTYTGNVSGWLNASAFPYGILYEVTTSDNIHINQGKWSENTKGLYSGNNINSLTVKNTKNFTTSDKTASYAFTDDGKRVAKFELNDKAGNTVTINITANLDRVNPTCTTSKSHLDTEDGVNVSITCRDGGSGCSSSNTLSYTKVKGNRTYTVRDTAGNSNTCGVSVSSYNCHPYQYACGSYACGSYACGSYACGSYVCGRHCWSTANGRGMGSYHCKNSYCTSYCTAYCTAYCTSYCTGYKTCYK